MRYNNYSGQVPDPKTGEPAACTELQQQMIKTKIGTITLLDMVKNSWRGKLMGRVPEY